jgi:hypothetical protein
MAALPPYVFSCPQCGEQVEIPLSMTPGPKVAGGCVLATLHTDPTALDAHILAAHT